MQFLLLTRVAIFGILATSIAVCCSTGNKVVTVNASQLKYLEELSKEIYDSDKFRTMVDSNLDTRTFYNKMLSEKHGHPSIVDSFDWIETIYAFNDSTIVFEGPVIEESVWRSLRWVVMRSNGSIKESFRKEGDYSFVKLSKINQNWAKGYRFYTLAN